MYRFLLIILSLLMLPGCQPTPGADIVTQRTEIAPSTKGDRADQTSKIPTSYRDTLTDKELTVDFGATVNVPDQATFSIPQINPVGFSDDDVKLLVSTLFEGHDATSLITPLTKDKYEKLYLEALQNLHSNKQNPQSGVNTSVLEDQVEYYQKRYEAAPESSDNITPYPADELQTISSGKSLRSSANMGQAEDAVIEIMASEFGTHMSFLNGPKYMDVSMSYPELTMSTPINVKISMQDAQELADAVIDKIGGGRYALSAYVVGVISEGGLYDTLGDYLEQCHRFIYTEQINSIPVTYTDKIQTAVSGEDAYNSVPIWSYIAINVDDTGVVGVQWEGNNEIIGYESLDASILSFDNIMDIARKQLPITYAWNDETKITKVNVTRITLGYMPILQKNTIGYSIMAPVWDFFGTLEQDGVDPQACAGNNSLLTINALDGSIINRNIGY